MLRQSAVAIVTDVRFGLRMMGRSPAFTAVALLMIALGTGANAAMLSVIDAAMLHSPFVDADRLAMISVELSDRTVTAALTTDQYRSLVASPTPFDAMGAMGGGMRPTVTGRGELRKLNVECVTAGVFSVLGTPPLLGRTFTAAEDGPGGPPAVVLSYDYWKREFGGSPDAIGRSVTLNGVPAAIIGVMPRHFLGPMSRNSTEAWLPLGPAIGVSSTYGCTARGSFNAFAKVRRGVTLDAAAAQADAAAGIGRMPAFRGGLGSKLRLEPLTEHALYDFRTPLIVLLAAVGLVLLIASVNVANLQLERVFDRRHEHAVRLALGATRARVVRQALVETLLLYFVGAAAGVLLAGWTLQLTAGLIPATLPHVREIQLNGRVFAATFAIATLAGVIVGVWPARQTATGSLADALRGSSRSIAGVRSRSRAVMVSIQIALSLTLLVAAMLLIRTFLILNPSDPGFRPQDKLTAIVRLQGPAANGSGPLMFLDAVIARLEHAPGVLGVSATTYVPMSGNVSQVDVTAGALQGLAWSGFITPDFFAEMGVPIVRGRSFGGRDLTGAPPVAIVNEAFARKAWPDRDALGATLIMKDFADKVETREVVGIVRDFRSSAGDTRIRPEVYIPFAQDPIGFINLIVRGADPADHRLRDAMVRAVAAVDASQVVDRIETYDQVLADRTATWRFGAWLLGVFAGLAVTLAAIGLAASIAWWVSQRTREIGVRMALGADPGQVARMFMRQAFALTAVGVMIGLGAAAASTRFLQSWLYGVTPLDPGTFAASAVSMVLIAALASYLPARRAARIDPLITLRAE